MPRINPRDLVRESLHQEWAEFAREHPRLAGALDESLLVEQATDELSDDPEFRKAMQHAAAVGQATEALRDLVRGFVRRWIGRLL
jgi:hypothetical protein